MVLCSDLRIIGTSNGQTSETSGSNHQGVTGSSWGYFTTPPRRATLGFSYVHQEMGFRLSKPLRLLAELVRTKSSVMEQTNNFFQFIKDKFETIEIEADSTFSNADDGRRLLLCLEGQPVTVLCSNLSYVILENEVREAMVLDITEIQVISQGFLVELQRFLERTYLLDHEEFDVSGLLADIGVRENQIEIAEEQLWSVSCLAESQLEARVRAIVTEGTQVYDSWKEDHEEGLLQKTLLIRGIEGNPAAVALERILRTVKDVVQCGRQLMRRSDRVRTARTVKGLGTRIKVWLEERGTTEQWTWNTQGGTIGDLENDIQVQLQEQGQKILAFILQIPFVKPEDEVESTTVVTLPVKPLGHGWSLGLRLWDANIQHTIHKIKDRHFVAKTPVRMENKLGWVLVSVEKSELEELEGTHESCYQSILQEERPRCERQVTYLGTDQNPVAYMEGTTLYVVSEKCSTIQVKCPENGTDLETCGLEVWMIPETCFPVVNGNEAGYVCQSCDLDLFQKTRVGARRTGSPKLTALNRQQWSRNL